jgi:hypothetical protein
MHGGKDVLEGIGAAERMSAIIKKRFSRVVDVVFTGKTEISLEDEQVTQMIKTSEENNLRAKGIDPERVIGVSSDFHIPRVKYLFDYYDVDADTVSAPSLDIWQFFMSIVREYMAYVKLFLVTVL